MFSSLFMMDGYMKFALSEDPGSSDLGTHNLPVVEY